MLFVVKREREREERERNLKKKSARALEERTAKRGMVSSGMPGPNMASLEHH